MGPQWKMGRQIMEVGDTSVVKSLAGPLIGEEWGSWGLELDDSPEPKVRALFGGGALRDGHG